MNDKKILQLVKAASELDAFEADVSGRESTLQGVSPRRSRLFRWAAIGFPAAAALAFMLLNQPSLEISRFQVVAIAQRGADSDSGYRCRLTVSRPANVHVVLVDERLEPWIIPVADDRKGYVWRVEEQWEFRPPSQLNEDDIRGPSRPAYAMVIAATGGSPTVDQLLAAIPDPIAAADSSSTAILEALRRIADDLTARFGCAVRFEPFP